MFLHNPKGGVAVTSHNWFNFTDEEKELLIDLLSSSGSAEIRNLWAKISNQSQRFPRITVGVYGGRVQWVMGNPFPIRVCDYDGNEADLPRVDERGQRCRIWFELPDPKVENHDTL